MFNGYFFTKGAKFAEIIFYAYVLSQAIISYASYQCDKAKMQTEGQIAFQLYIII